MINHTYLQKGLLATARSHQAGSIVSHLGASVLAGYYLGEDYPDLPTAVMKGIQGKLQRIIQGEEALSTSSKKQGSEPESCSQQPETVNSLHLLKGIRKTRSSP